MNIIIPFVLLGIALVVSVTYSALWITLAIVVNGIDSNFKKVSLHYGPVVISLLLLSALVTAFFV